MTDIGVVEGMVLLAVTVVAILWVLRSTPKQGTKVLRRWGIAEPTEEQGRIAAGYLKRRRNLFPFVAMGVFVLAGVGKSLLAAGGRAPWEGVLLFSVVASLLVAELIATLRRPSDRTRSATLTPRRFTDIVPRFGLVALGLLTVLAVGHALATLAALPFAEARNAWRERHLAELERLEVWDAQVVDTSLGSVWFALLAFAVCVIASLSVVRLCQVRGPLTADLAVDAALRIRSGRVALGTAVLLAVGVLGSINSSWQDLAEGASSIVHLPAELAADYPAVPGWIVPADRFAGWVHVVVLLGVFVWAILVSPWRRQRLVEATT